MHGYPARMLPTVITGPVHLDLERGALGVSVARRVVGAVCAQAGLDLNRLSDAAILVEALTAEAPSAGLDPRVRFAVIPGRGSVTIEVGPLSDDGRERLRQALEVPGVGSVVDRLPDTVRSRTSGDGAFIVAAFGAGVSPGGPSGT